MAVARFGVDEINPQSPDDVNFNASGATLDGSNVLQVNYDDTEFTGAEGKTRLILALEHILNGLKEGHQDWPAS